MTAREVKLDNQNSREPVTCENGLEIYKMYVIDVVVISGPYFVLDYHGNIGMFPRLYIWFMLAKKPLCV